VVRVGRGRQSSARGRERRELPASGREGRELLTPGRERKQGAAGGGRGSRMQ
jgi:hypothetical protein